MPKQNNKEFLMLFILTILYIFSNLRKRVSVHRILWILCYIHEDARASSDFNFDAGNILTPYLAIH